METGQRELSEERESWSKPERLTFKILYMGKLVSGMERFQLTVLENVPEKEWSVMSGEVREVKES